MFIEANQARKSVNINFKRERFYYITSSKMYVANISASWSKSETNFNINTNKKKKKKKLNWKYVTLWRNNYITASTSLQEYIDNVYIQRSSNILLEEDARMINVQASGLNSHQNLPILTKPLLPFPQVTYPASNIHRANTPALSPVCKKMKKNANNESKG